MALRTVVLANQKGGSGKSTWCSHLAVGLELRGEGPVMLADFDPQGTLSKWWNRREAAQPSFMACETPAELAGRKPQLEADGYRWLVLDTAAGVSPKSASVISYADLVVIPIQPGIDDLEATDPTITLCEASGVPFLFLLNRTKPNTLAATQAVAALSAIAPVATVIGDRTQYSTCKNDGRTIMEVSAKGEGAREQAYVVQVVLDHFNGKHRRNRAKAQGAALA